VENPTFKGTDGKTYTVTRKTGIGVADKFEVTADGERVRMLHPDIDQAYTALFEDCKVGKVKLTPVTRTPATIAREIGRNWGTSKSRIYFGAVPYLDAMRTLQSKDDAYGLDSAQSIIAYFLANANSYRGGLAKAHKEELKALLK
jgi:hypothetical protein